MLREKLIFAMTDIDSHDIDAVGEILGYKKIRQAVRQSTTTIRRALMIAAVIAAFLALSVTAYAIATRLFMSRQALDESPEPGIDQVTYNFEPAADEFIDCKHWMPSIIPGDYELDFVSDYFEYNGSQNIRYKNAVGKTIEFMYGKPGPGMSVTFDNVISEEDITIAEHTGVLTRTASYNALLWTNDAAGYAFTLSCTDTGLDIVAIAESVIGLDEPVTATNANNTANAIASLGDYKPTYLPEGYVENGYYGKPESGEGDSYSYGYVRRYYVNKDTNRNINFAYETYRLEDMENTARNVLSLYASGESVEVNGFPGVVEVNANGATVVWVDTGNMIAYTLYTDDVQPDELLKIAESINNK